MTRGVSSKHHLFECYNIHTIYHFHEGFCTFWDVFCVPAIPVCFFFFVLLGAFPSSNLCDQLCLLLCLYHDVTSNLPFVLTPYLLAISEEDIH